MDIENLIFSSDDEEDRPITRVYRDRIHFNIINDFQFKEKFRLRRTEVDFLLERIGGQLIDSHKNMTISPRQQVLV